MTDSLFHVSDNPSITNFEPRLVTNPNLGLEGTAVFAITEQLLPNYLLPRDCPRVTFYARPESKREDVERLLGGSRHVVAIESGWLERVMNGRIHIYTLPTDTFTVWDEGAGYFISRQPVMPLSMRTVDNMLLELTKHDVEIRILPDLRPLRSEVINASLQFSIIRWRNVKQKTSDFLPV